MKKLFFLFLVVGMSIKSVGQEDVSRLTLGIGTGVNHLFDNIYDYSLTTDSNNNLEITKLNRNSIVVSPVIVFRLGKTQIIRDDKNVKFYNNSNKKKVGDGDLLPDGNLRRFSILLSTDLINIQADKVSYNKRIDGGIGIGYSFSPDLMLGLFYEIKSYRQLREYVVEQYENKPIPNGTSFYNALDETNNNLFYNKQLEGLSLKLIFNFNTL